MAGIIILGIAAAVEAVHGEIADRRSPLICLNADANVLSSTSPLTSSPSSTSSSSPPTRSSRLAPFRRGAGSDDQTHSSSTDEEGAGTGAGGGLGGAVSGKEITISKRGLKKLMMEWDLRAGEMAWRIREIERHNRAQGATKCWAGYVKDLPAMRDCLSEAKEVRLRLVEALLYLRALPEPLKKTSLNPLHRRPKDVLPVTQLPPSLNGLPVPLPKPPKSGDWRLVLDRVLPGYEEAAGDWEGREEALEAVLREVREGEEGGMPPSYYDTTVAPSSRAAA